MKKLLRVSLAFLATAMLFTSCAKKDDDNGPQTGSEPTLMEIARQSAEHTLFVRAVEHAGLTSVLESAGTMTLFAPNDSAFRALLSLEPTWNEVEDIPTAMLAIILPYHILGQELNSTALTVNGTNGSYFNTLSPGPGGAKTSLFVNQQRGVFINKTVQVTTPNLEASNGILHVVNAVILPQNIVGLVSNDGQFSSLLAALTDAGSAIDYVTTLNGTGPFTVFAPSNAAFQALLNSDSTWNTISDIPDSLLDAVLTYHVVNGTNARSSSLTDNQQITMLSGGTITVDLSSGVKIETDNSGQSVNVTAADIQGTNGVIHVIDQVLIP